MTVSSKTNTVTITEDPDTGGNNVGCCTNIEITEAAQTITFDHNASCGGGGPRVYVRFADGASENTFDTGTRTDGPASYTLVNSGKIKSFAFINDRGDGGEVTCSRLVIAGKVINV